MIGIIDERSIDLLRLQSADTLGSTGKVVQTTWADDGQGGQTASTTLGTAFPCGLYGSPMTTKQLALPNRESTEVEEEYTLVVAAGKVLANNTVLDVDGEIFAVRGPRSHAPAAGAYPTEIVRYYHVVRQS